MQKFESIEQFARFLWKDAISEAQITVLKTWVGEALTFSQRGLWRKLSESRLFARYVPRRYAEGVWIFGRQCGKSHQLGTTAILWCIYCETHDVVEGERLSVLCFSPVLRQSIFDAVAEKIDSIPELQELVDNSAPASGEIRFKNGIDLLSISANPAYARGKTACLCVVDEACFLHTGADFTNNLTSLLESIRPSLIVKQGRLLLMSSPGGTEGPLHSAWVNRADDPETLVFRAASQTLNPGLSSALLERERKKGDAYFRREFLGEFTETSGNPFLNPEMLDKAVLRGVPEIAPDKADIFVCSGIDLADRRDWCAIAHATVRTVDGVPKVVVLGSRVWKPGPNGHQVLTVLEEMGQDCQRFKSRKAHGDQKSMSVAEQVLGKYQITFQRVISAGAGSEQRYRTFNGLLNEGRIVLPDSEELLKQLRRLTEKTTDGNRFLVEGGRGAKDDAAVSCILACALAAENLNACAPTMTAIFTDGPHRDDDRGWLRLNPDGSLADPRVRIPSFARDPRN